MGRTKQFDEQDILEKAMELFWKQGYNATSINDLVNHLKVNRASLYSTYGGKKELFDKALNHYMATSHKSLRVFIEKKESPKRIIKSLFESAINESYTDIDKKGCFVVNATTELAATDEVTQLSVQHNMDKVLGVFKTILLKAQELNEIRADKDIDALAMSLYITYSGLRVIGKSDVDRDKLTKGINTYLELLD